MLMAADLHHLSLPPGQYCFPGAVQLHFAIALLSVTAYCLAVWLLGVHACISQSCHVMTPIVTAWHL